MNTAFSKLVDAAIAALGRTPAVCDTIERARVRAYGEGMEYALSVQWDGALPERGAIFGAPVDWTVKLVVDCYACSMRETGDLAVDPLIGDVYGRLAQDITVGGTAYDLGVPTIEIEHTAEGKKTGWARLTYLAQVRTAELTLE